MLQFVELSASAHERFFRASLNRLVASPRKDAMKASLRTDSFIMEDFSVAPTQERLWFRRLMTWHRLKKLERELRASRKFEEVCRELSCPNLADLERTYGDQIHQKIHQLTAGHSPRT